MDSTLLNKPELVYELKVRSIEFSNTATAEELRILLDPLIILNPSPDIESPYSLEQDLEEVGKCLAFITAKINSFSNRFKPKINTYILHLTDRLNRMDIHTEIPMETINKFNKLTLEFKKNKENFKELISESESNSSTIINIPEKNTSDIDKLAQKLSFFSHNNMTDFKKFNFKGETCPMEFIQKVEEFAIARNISHKQLHSHIYDLLSGIPLDWFRSRVNKLVNWDLFKNKFIEDFEIHDHDFKLKKTIDMRKQKVNERIILYFSSMEGLFEKLHEKLTEKSKIDILRRNMSPLISSRLLPTDLESIDILFKSCKWYENCLLMQNNDSITETFNQSTSKSTFIPRFLHNNNNPHINTVNRFRFTCPRCRTNNHLFKECTNNNIICFRCGKQDVKYPDCTNCHKTSKN